MGLLPNYDKIIELVKTGATIEAQEKIMELREMHLSLREEVLKLREENRTLLDRLDAREKLRFDGHHYWADNDGEADGPFCPNCKDSQSKLIHLHAREPGAWRCPTCDGFFPDQTYRDPPGCTVLRSDFDVFED